MKKILLSLLSIGAVAVVAVAATGAFFSDTETSTGNTFTAGELDLQIDSECNYYQNDLEVGCLNNNVPFGTWTLGDLGDLTAKKFFDFLDVKPGDYGENTISMHVFDNDAWTCMNISPLANNDNGCTEPEADPLDGDDTTCGLGDGELAQNMEFFAWLDEGGDPGFECQPDVPGCTGDLTEGDNIWQVGEQPLFNNPPDGIGLASDVLSGRTYTLADSTQSIVPGSGPFIGSTTYYIGLAWCAGNLTNPGIGGNMFAGLLDCDGDAMGNDTQSDSMSADLSFYAEQSRNNPDFTCVPRI